MPEFKVGDVVQSKAYPHYEFVITFLFDDGDVRVGRFHASKEENSQLELQNMILSPDLLEHVKKETTDRPEFRNEYCPHYADENGQYDDGDDMADDEIPECDVVDTEDMFVIIHGDLLAEGHEDLAKEIWNLKNEYQKRGLSRADKD